VSIEDEVLGEPIDRRQKRTRIFDLLHWLQSEQMYLIAITWRRRTRTTQLAKAPLFFLWRSAAEAYTQKGCANSRRFAPRPAPRWDRAPDSNGPVVRTAVAVSPCLCMQAAL
jgi:hypothetical protein